MERQPLALDDVRAALGGQTGPRFWRSLDELADAPEFREFMHREFPREASVWEDGPSRRSFLKLAGATLALGGLASCARQPQEIIVPYQKQPENMLPGIPMHFASAIVLGGYATGVVVTAYDGRPTKIEGNKHHPASLGATDAITQAAILSLYDPDRAASLTYLDAIKPWDLFVQAAGELMAQQQTKNGEGLRILSRTVSSPSLRDMIATFQLNLPGMQWIQYEPCNGDNAAAGAALAFGQAAEPVYHFDKADIVLSLDADFLERGPGHVRYTRDFAARRDVRDHAGQEANTALNRLYAVEAFPSVTGAMADHRLALRPSQVESFARALANHRGIPAGSIDLAAVFGDAAAAVEIWIQAISDDFDSHRGAVAVVAGPEQPPIVHAIAHALNGQTGSIGAAVSYIAPVAPQTGAQTDNLAALADDMRAGKVDTLVILDANPVYEASPDIDFRGAMETLIKNGGTCVYNGLYVDETAELCQWIVPGLHELEGWGDAAAYDGTLAIIQPLIEPLYGGRSAYETLAAFTGEASKKSYDHVRAYWLGRSGLGEDAARFEPQWAEWLATGVIPGTASAPLTVTPKSNFADIPPAVTASTLEIAFRPDPMVYDGRFANNGWLQEAPKPITKMTWQNVVHIAPATGDAMGLHNDDVVTLSVNGAETEAALIFQPGHPKDSITVHLGYGRTRSGRVGDGAGFSAYALRSRSNLWNAFGPTLQRTGANKRLPRTEEHHTIDYTFEKGVKDAMVQAERRNLVRVAPAEKYHEDPAFAQHMGHAPGPNTTMYADRPWDGPRWGMVIDLNKCTGCNACLVACVAENNIPVVGPEQVVAGREMHWIRIDRYYRGDFDNPEIYHQPLPCMQCEDAPCEVVCPAAATVHSIEGLNDMIYNRCVGTRYCSNNCPYKVRRFNFLHFSKLQYGGKDYESLKLGRNPNVTVRSRGVMEKCTYCVQRINQARIDAKKKLTAAGQPEPGDDRKVRIDDSALKAACQQACPAGCISFGDLADPESNVAKAHKSPRNYTILADLNTRPRTTYLAKVTNPNPRLV